MYSSRWKQQQVGDTLAVQNTIENKIIVKVIMSRYL